MADVDVIKDLSEKIEGAARELGFNVEDLSLYLVGENQLLAPMAFKGAAKRYAHWSFGKKAEIFSQYTKSKGIDISFMDLLLMYNAPYVPILASAKLHQQVSAVVRAYACVDFIRQSDIWKARDFEEIRRGLSEHASFVSGLRKSPVVDAEKVEQLLTAAHSVAYQCSHSIALNGLTSDMLIELAEKTPNLDSWQRDLLKMVHEEWVWFLPFIETHFMIKGWASFWQRRLIKKADIPEELYWKCLFEFDNEIHVPDEPGPVNPAVVGSNIFEEIFQVQCHGDLNLFKKEAAGILKQENDISFIKKYLTQKVANDSGLLSYGQKGADGDDAKILEVKEISDQEGWEKVRDELASWIGGNAFPIIHVISNTDEEFSMEHEFEGRPLGSEEFDGVLEELKGFLNRKVSLIASSLDENGNEVKKKHWKSPTSSGTESLDSEAKPADPSVC